MSASNQKILRSVDRMEAYADNMKKEATQIREMLGVVSTTPNPKRVRYAAFSAMVLAKRNQTISRKK